MNNCFYFYTCLLPQFLTNYVHNQNITIIYFYQSKYANNNHSLIQSVKFINGTGKMYFCNFLSLSSYKIIVMYYFISNYSLHSYKISLSLSNAFTESKKVFCYIADRRMYCNIMIPFTFTYIISILPFFNSNSLICQ